jgi:hypothetical protein
MSDFEVMPIGTKNKIEELERENQKLDKIYALFEKYYPCTYHTYPSMDNPHGCTDCYNTGLAINDPFAGGVLNILEGDMKDE